MSGVSCELPLLSDVGIRNGGFLSCVRSDHLTGGHLGGQGFGLSLVRF
jgi:hypothetical protein